MHVETKEICEMWRRWLRLRKKATSATHNVTKSSLDESWIAFVHRWNTEATFPDLLPLREERRQRYGLAETLQIVCELSWSSIDLLALFTGKKAAETAEDTE